MGLTIDVADADAAASDEDAGATTGDSPDAVVVAPAELVLGVAVGARALGLLALVVRALVRLRRLRQVVGREVVLADVQPGLHLEPAQAEEAVVQLHGFLREVDRGQHRVSHAGRGGGGVGEEEVVFRECRAVRRERRSAAGA